MTCTAETRLSIQMGCCIVDGLNTWVMLTGALGALVKETKIEILNKKESI